MKASKMERITVAMESQPENHALQPTLESFKVGDHVGWNSEAGHVSGTITRVHTSDFKVNGYTHHCTKDNPQYEIKSSKTDHIAYHKAASLHHIGSSKESFEEPQEVSMEDALKLISLEAAANKGKKPEGTNPFPDGTSVWYHYRSAIGHATVMGVAKYGSTWDKTEFLLEQHDHHVSSSGSKEKKVIKHYGSALHKGKAPK